jgi:hypothetical protein
VILSTQISSRQKHLITLVFCSNIYNNSAFSASTSSSFSQRHRMFVYF